jgi:hypothetical protein
MVMVINVTNHKNMKGSSLVTITIELGAFHVLVVGYIGDHYH